MLGRLEQKRAGALKALALWLGLAALILQGFVPLAAMAAPAGHSIVICTIHGMQTIRIGADGKPVSSQVNPGGSAACAVCSDCTAAGGFVLPSPILPSQPVRTVEAAPTAASLPAPASRVLLPYGSRAPPAIRVTNA